MRSGQADYCRSRIMNWREFLHSVSMLIKVASKPSWEEFSISARIVMLGVAVLGTMAFVIRFLMLAIQ